MPARNGARCARFLEYSWKGQPLPTGCFCMGPASSGKAVGNRGAALILEPVACAKSAETYRVRVCLRSAEVRRLIAQPCAKEPGGACACLGRFDKEEAAGGP